MTEIQEDVIEVDMFIDGQRWLLIDGLVELSKSGTPNYVDLVMTPDPGETLGELPDDTNELVGTPFSLNVDTELISERDTNANEETLLFKGNLANISPTGENVYEGIAYDPSQQAFNVDDSGSFLNQKTTIPIPEYDPDTDDNTFTVDSKELIENVVIDAGLSGDEYVIDLKREGVTVENSKGSYTGGYRRTVTFDDIYVNVKEILDKTANRTESSWWFDKDGVFHFGVPRPSKHELRFITDTTAGLVTPPYQSVKVIGSGVVSEEGYGRSTMNAENEIVVEARIPSSTEKETYQEIQNQAEDPPERVNGNNTGEAILYESREPQFDYRNAEISTQEQAESVAKEITKKLDEQQAKGDITVVGFPEVVPYDGVKMPNTDEQPMGGYSYGIYAVEHRLNASDGFITKIKVGQPVGVTATTVEPNQNPNTTSQDPEDYVRSGRIRQGPPGTGLYQADEPFQE